MHIAMANFYLLSVTGPKMPADLKQGMETTVTAKPDVINWLKRSLDAVKEAHLTEKPKGLERKVLSVRSILWTETRRSMACTFVLFTATNIWDS
jgi:hypothetical protein